jgi:hypothetical protein
MIHWMSCGEHVVRGGRWHGEHATKENMDLLDALYAADGGTPKKQPGDSLVLGADRLMSHLKQCVETHTKNMVPELFIVGLSGRVGPLVGGLEMVLDFETKEVGNFAFGGLSTGLATASASIGVAAGSGWKGTSRGSRIKDAYSAWFTAVSAGGETPGIEIGVGAMLALSSDSKIVTYLATNPQCDAVITVTAGVSLGVDLLALPVSVDAYSTYFLSHDAVNIDCSKTKSWRVCMLFWAAVELSLATGGTGTALLVPALLQSALH